MLCSIIKVYQLKTFIPDHQVVLLDELVIVSVSSKRVFMTAECDGEGNMGI